MSHGKGFKDQAKRNKLGFDTTCQISALLDMLRHERRRHDDFQAFCDLLDAVLPRLDDLNNAAMSLFDDPGALKDANIATVVHGQTFGGGAA